MIAAMRTLIACHATRGDGTVEWYEGPLGPVTIATIKRINSENPGMMVINPDNRPQEDDENWCRMPKKSDEDFAAHLLWWAAGCPD